MNSSGAISVCLASWNGEQYIREQIDSILSQLREGDELLVSDDGSTDTTPDILRSYGSSIRVVGTARAGGVVPNFERVLAEARGGIVVLSDQDDVWLEGRLDLVRERLGHVELLMMNGEVVDADLRSLGVDVHGFVRFRPGFLKTFVSNRYVGCCMAFRRELLAVALPFPAGIQIHDWYIALVGELLFSCESRKERTILFRRHGRNDSTTGLPSPRPIWKRVGARAVMLHAVALAYLRYVRLRAGI